MKYVTPTLITLAIMTPLGLLRPVSAAVTANTDTTTTKTASGTTTLSTAQQEQHLKAIKTKGDEEIARRLAALGKISSMLQSDQKLTASDKATLLSEVTSTTSGLTTLKTQLDNETTLDAAKTDVQSMITEYRVYALILPKVHLVKLADDQVQAETALSDAATKLQTKLTDLQSKGKNVDSLQTTLNDMTAKIASAQKISSTIQSSVITLQPTDYNSDHKVLNGYNTQLKTAHADLVTARQDANTIIKGINSL